MTSPGDQGPVYCKGAEEPPIIKSETMEPRRAETKECSYRLGRSPRIRTDKRCDPSEEVEEEVHAID
jgi:hypothetical protein